MKYLILLSFLISLTSLPVSAESEDFSMCPLCDRLGNVTCPFGYEAGCQRLNAEISEPKCIFLENTYVSGCLTFIGIKKIEGLDVLFMLGPNVKAEITGGGETYTLNREAIGCKRL